MFCTNCGKELNPNDKFCANCGCEVKASQTERRGYDNVVFNPPFRMEAEKKTAQILKNREEFKGFKEMAQENNRRNVKSKAKMDWNLEGFPESMTAKNGKSGFDWDSVVERRKSGRSFGFEKRDLTSTMEHKKVDPEQEVPETPVVPEENVSLGLPPEDTRIISLEELEKELYDLEEELRSDTARTAKYAPLKDNEPDTPEDLEAYLDGNPKSKKEPEENKAEEEAIANVKAGGPMVWNLDGDKKSTKVSMAPMGLVWGIDPDELKAKKKAKAAPKTETKMVWDLDAIEKEKKAAEKEAAPKEPVTEAPAGTTTLSSVLK